jgi:hypothetical protein
MDTLTVSRSQIIVYSEQDASPLWAAPDYAHTTSPRNRVYKAILDVDYVNGLTEAEREILRIPEDVYHTDDISEHHRLVAKPSGTPGTEFNLFSSMCEDGLHRLVLDYDCEIEDPKKSALNFLDCWVDALVYLAPRTVLMVPSSTAGHYHVYLPTEAYTERQFTEILDEFDTYGILEHGYIHASLSREQTVVRAPWVKKFAI